MDDTKVVFKTSDRLVQKLYDSADAKCRQNIRFFGDRKVLIEGGGYHKVWIETQPMGGAMYGKRDIEIALNNCKIFMDNQRPDGRLPGSVEYRNDILIPQYDKFQGFCFPGPALEVYYLTGKDQSYLNQLYEVLLKYDEYLWKYRDSDNDGCLESFCKFDTGEDNAIRYGDAPNYWEEDEAPTGYEVVPMASVDFMSYSYSARETMAEIARIKGNSDLYERHNKEALEVRRRLIDNFWDKEREAFFDRDKNHKMMSILTHNNLRMMYWHSMDREKADRFVKRHLLNEKEFWTMMPLPSVAVNDSMYRNYDVNNWSGQPQALTYQRAIEALEYYGYYGFIPALGRKLFEAIGEDCIFVQQYDPFTMKPSLEGVEGKQDAYGPAMLSVLEYVSRMYGVCYKKDRLIWSCIKKEEGYYEQHLNGHIYRLERDKDKAYGFIDGKEVLSFDKGVRIETDMEGKELYRYDAL